MNYKRLLAAGLACLLLAGCGPVQTTPLTEEPPAEGNTIAYVPLDDRPDNEERVIYLAESLGYALEMPEKDLYRTRLNGQPLNENGTQFGDRAALYEWVLAQETAGCDRYILSLDQLLSGGLVNSRAMTAHEDVVLSDGSVLTEYELLENLLAVLAADEENLVWLLDSVMRLAPTVGYQHWTLEEYNALRSYGAQPRRELSDTTGAEAVTLGYHLGADGQEISLSEFGLEDWEVEEYLSARSRKLELADRMLRLRSDGAENLCVLIGIDDSSEADSIQKPEIDYLRSLLRDGDALLSGVDDLAFKALARLYLQDIGRWDGAAVSVRYYGGTEHLPACAYDYKPLTEIVAEHFDFFGLTEAGADAAELDVLVLTQPADAAKKEDYCAALITQLNENRKAGKSTILIDAGNAVYGTAFHKKLTAETELGWLLSYAGALDMAIVTGTALSHGVARYAYLQGGETTEAAERAFIRTLADSILKDFCYRHVVRAEVTAHARDTLGGVSDNFWTPDIDRQALLELMERRMTEETAPVIENLERSNFISSLAPYEERGWGGIGLTNYCFPWDRAFEMGMDIRLGEFTKPHKEVFGVYYS